MIKGIINGQSFSVSTPLIVSETIDYIYAEFEFSDDWQGFEKWAHFAHRSVERGEEIEVVYDVKITDDRIDKSEHLNLTPGIWSVYIHGTRFEDGNAVERITTECDTVAVAECGVLDGEPLPLTPVSAAERIMALIGDLSRLDSDVKTDIVSAVNEIAARIGKAGTNGVGVADAYVGEDGVLYIELDSGDEIQAGYVVGADGYTPQKGVDYFDGVDGQPGADGKTPVRGTDYFTEADKAELVADVLASLPTWNGGSY